MIISSSSTTTATIIQEGSRLQQGQALGSCGVAQSFNQHCMKVFDSSNRHQQNKNKT